MQLWPIGDQITRPGKRAALDRLAQTSQIPGMRRGQKNAWLGSVVVHQNRHRNG